MARIHQIISTISEAPDASTQTQEEFDANCTAMLEDISKLPEELNTWSEEVNAIADQAHTAYLITQSFNFFRCTTPPNDTVPTHTITPKSDANRVDMSINPKGPGAVMIGYPDNETDGGNKRGFYAVDFQMQRGEPDQVASGQSSAIIGGICNRASGLCSVAIGGGNYSATTYTNAATNTGAIVIGGMSNTASGRSTCGLNALVSDAAEHYSMIIGGRYVKTASQYSIATGFSSGPETSTANRTFEIQPNGGDVYASGSITGSQTFTDYAEYFENLSTGEIPLGTIVTRVGRKVRPAQTGDRILGVVSGTAGVCLGDSPFTWQGRYLTGEFGQPLWETIPDPAWDEKILDMDWTPGQGQTEADRPQIDNPEPQPNINVRKQNPDYDPGCEQVPRSERPDEWTCVGLVGQVHVRIDATVTTETEFIAPSSGGGIGTASAGETRLELMEIRAEYDPDKGYGVGLCLVR